MKVRNAYMRSLQFGCSPKSVSVPQHGINHLIRRHDLLLLEVQPSPEEWLFI